jgi:hypothetical protein
MRTTAPAEVRKTELEKTGSFPIPLIGAGKPSEFRPCTERVPLRSAWRAYHW